MDEREPTLDPAPGWASGSVRFGRGPSIATRIVHWIDERGRAACGARPRPPLHREPSNAPDHDRCLACREARRKR
jgi:hypothetical protein